MFTSLYAFSSLCFASWISTGHAQGTAATCGPGYDWMTNSLYQNPCLVASWLYVPCYGPGAPSVVSKIDPGVNYGGPTSRDPSQSTPCDCNTVLYSLRAACGQCQGGGALPWPSYTFNCLSTYNGTYPETIPGGTAVPQWAFLDLIGNTTFNLEAAQTLASQGLPDITNATQNTSSVLPVFTSSTRFASGSSLPTAIASTGPSAFAQHSNTGAIVGAAVGGVLAFLLLVAVVFCVVFRRRRQTHMDPSVPDSSQTAPAREASISETSYHPLKEEGRSIIGHTGFYDPDDPRTYPPPAEAPSSGTAPNYTGLPQIMP